jgi:hypothetical protein
MGLQYIHIRLPVQAWALQDDEQRSLEEYCESLWMKMIGKPDSGKLNVRCDEGVLEIEYGWASEALSTERDRNR